MAVSNTNGEGAVGMFTGDSAISVLVEEFEDIIDKEELYVRAEAIISQTPEQKLTNEKRLFDALSEADEVSADRDNNIQTEPQHPVSEEAVAEFFRDYFQQLEEQFTQFREDLHDQVLSHPTETETYVVVAVFCDRFVELLRYIGEAGINEREIDAVLAIYDIYASHHALLASGRRDGLYPELIADVFYFDHYFGHAIGVDDNPTIDEVPQELLKQQVLIDGAVDIYQRRDISVGRGAEIAETDRTVFEQALLAAGVRPEYGPDDPTKLRSGELDVE